MILSVYRLYIMSYKKEPNKTTLQSLEKLEKPADELCEKFLQSCKYGGEFFSFTGNHGKKIVPVFVDYQEFWGELKQQQNIAENEKKKVLDFTKNLKKYDDKTLETLVNRLFQSGLILCLNEGVKTVEKNMISNIGAELYKKLVSFNKLKSLNCFSQKQKYLLIKNKTIVENKDTFTKIKYNRKAKENILTYLRADIRGLISYEEFVLAYDLCQVFYLFYTGSTWTDDLVRSEIKLELVKLNLFKSIKQEMLNETQHINKLDQDFFIIALRNLISACKEIRSYCDKCQDQTKGQYWGKDWVDIFNNIFELASMCTYLFASLDGENQSGVIYYFNKLLESLQLLGGHKINGDSKEHKGKYSLRKKLYEIRMGQKQHDDKLKYDALVACVKLFPKLVYTKEDNWEVKHDRINKFPDDSKQRWNNIVRHYFESAAVQLLIYYFAAEAVNFCKRKKDDSSFLKQVNMEKLSLLFKNACKYYNFFEPGKSKIKTPLSKVEKPDNCVGTKINSLNQKVIKMASPVKNKSRRSSEKPNKKINFSESEKKAAKFLHDSIREKMQKLFAKNSKIIEEIDQNPILYDDFWGNFYLYDNVDVSSAISAVINIINDKNNKSFNEFMRVLLKSAFYLKSKRQIHIKFLKKVIGLKKHENLYNLIFTEVFQAGGFCNSDNLFEKLRELSSDEIFQQFQKIEQKIFSGKIKIENAILQAIILWQFFYLFFTRDNNLLRIKVLTKIASLQMDKSYNSRLKTKELKLSASVLINACNTVVASGEESEASSSAKKIFKQIMIFTYAVQCAKCKFDLQELQKHADILSVQILAKSLKVNEKVLKLKDAFEENSLEQQIKFIIFCFEDKEELLDILYTYQFSNCQFAQLFLRYAIDICAQYFNKSEAKVFLIDDPICCEVLRIFDIAVSLYCGKDVDNNLHFAQSIVKKVKENLQNKINALIEKGCKHIKEELEKEILKELIISEPKKNPEESKQDIELKLKSVTWEHVCLEITRICMGAFNELLGDNNKKSFSDLNTQLKCIFREIEAAVISNSDKKNQQHNSSSKKTKTLTQEQKQKIIRKIKLFFCRSAEPKQPVRVDTKNHTANRNRNKEIAFTRRIDFRSYITERLNRCNPFGPIYHFIDKCKIEKFDEKTFNQVMLNNGQLNFLPIQANKYTKEECKIVLKALFYEELQLHHIIARFSNSLFLVGTLFPRLKFFGALYQIQSWSVFSYSFSGITLVAKNVYSSKGDILSFSSREFLLERNPLSKDSQKRLITYINDILDDMPGVDGYEVIYETEVNVIEMVKLLEKEGVANAQFPDDPRVKILSAFVDHKNGCECFKSLKAEQLYIFRSFSIHQPKIIDDIDLNNKKHELNKNKHYYYLLCKFVVEKMYGKPEARGTLWYLEQLLRNKRMKDIAEALKSMVEISLSESNYTQHYHKNALYHACKKIIIKSSEGLKTNKLTNKKFLRSLIIGICDFIEHKNFMGMCLDNELRQVVDDLFTCSIQEVSHEYEKIKFESREQRLNSRNFIKILQQSPENSIKLSEYSENDYLTNMQMLFLDFSTHACIFMPRVFGDLITIYLRKLYLEIVENKLKGANNKISFKGGIPVLNFKNFISHDKKPKDFVIKVQKQINELKQLVSEHQSIKTINNHLVCFEQNWFWDAAKEIFNDYQSNKNNVKKFYACVFCIVVFLQDKSLNGFAKKIGLSGEKWINIVEEGNKRIDHLVQNDLKQYLHFILTKKLPEEKENSLREKSKFAVCLDFYKEMANGCKGKGAIALLVYQDFFKVFFPLITRPQFKKFRLELLRIYNLLSKEVDLPIIKNPREFSLAHSIGLLESILLICQHHKKPCYHIVYHKCLRFVEERRLLENMKSQASERVLSEAEVFKIMYCMQKLNVREGNLLYVQMYNGFSGGKELPVNMCFLSSSLVKKVWGTFLENDLMCQEGYVLNYLNKYFNYLLDKRTNDSNFQEVKPREHCQLKAYIEHVNDTTGSYNQQRFFKKVIKPNELKCITDDLFKLQARIKFWFYEWFERNGGQYFFTSGIKKAVLKGVNKLIPKISERLQHQAMDEGAIIPESAIRLIVLSNVAKALIKHELKSGEKIMVSSEIFNFNKKLKRKYEQSVKSMRQVQISKEDKELFKDEKKMGELLSLEQKKDRREDNKSEEDNKFKYANI